LHKNDLFLPKKKAPGSPLAAPSLAEAPTLQLAPAAQNRLARQPALVLPTPQTQPLKSRAQVLPAAPGRCGGVLKKQ
jgi:hypothetical protein